MDVFDLVAKIRLDDSEYKDGVDKAQGSFSKLASGVGKGLATAAKVGAAAVGAAAAGVTALAKNALDGFGQYEQLAGGAKLLWGDAYDFIADKARTAFKDVQMSQNDYLQQVNGFSTGLKTALGGNAQAAAELAHKIVVAEADIVAATGQSQEMVQNAFNGIMRSNFTMLDNLQLGITPTKEGFQEVIDKVNEWNKANGEATKYQIDNLADCQAALVDYIKMHGMSSYAANEAAGTIQGSMASVKAAWQNLVVGMADSSADIGSLINDFVESSVAMADQIMPRIEQTLVGIGALVAGLAPIIAERIPTLVESLLPTLLIAAVGMVTTVFNALPGLIDSLLPIVIQAGLDVLFAFLTTLRDNFGMLFKTAIDAIMQIVDGLLAPESIDLLIDTAATVISEIVWGLIDALPKLMESAMELILRLVDYITDPNVLTELLRATLAILVEIAYGLIDAIPQLVKAAMQIIVSLRSFLLKPENIALLISAALQIIIALATGLINALPELLKAAVKLPETIINTIIETDWGKIGGDIIDGIKRGISAAWDGLKGWFNGIWDSLFNRDVEISAGGSTYRSRINGSHATGLDYVPFDGYRAILHRGETVLTSAEARAWRNGESGASNSRVASLLVDLINVIASGNAELVEAVSADKKLSVSGRDFARLVKEYA